jgi:diguanylate cyclase (GGDEF)-like protein
LNNFKHINDTYGHPAGDLVLKEFAARLNNVIRGADLAVRLGGDEFLVLLPECTLHQLELVLGRLSSLEVDWQSQKIPITFSAGWKQYELGERPEEMLARADEVLYDRKRAAKKAQPLAATRHQESEQRTQTDPEPASLHILVDLTCPHCHKKNSVALDTRSGSSAATAREAQCAHCKQTWEPVLSGPIMAGPFPK